MTEQDWLTSNNPAEMGEFLLGRPGATYTGVGELTPGKRISDHKMRLYCAAASSLQPPGLAMDSWIKWGNAPRKDWDPDTAHLSHWTTFNTRQGWDHWMQRDHPTEESRANILRDLVGNPFRPAKETIGTWRHLLSWQGGTIPRLATAAYDNPKEYNTLDNDRLLVLSDALEEAGCDSVQILNHLRNEVIGTYAEYEDYKKVKEGLITEIPRRHYRGCWVLDLILGKRLI